jgi:MarR family 2-MHQ and catechol resistance regulon transcriptional repressor
LRAQQLRYDGPVSELDDPRIDAFGMLLEAHAEVANVVGRELELACSLPANVVGVLVRLARSPGHSLRMTALARDMTISTSGLTRLIDRIEAAGLVERQPCPGDRRGFNAVLTPAGRERIEAVAGFHVAQLDRHLAAHLDGDELAALTGLLRKVRDGVRGSGCREVLLPDSEE